MRKLFCLLIITTVGVVSLHSQEHKTKHDSTSFVTPSDTLNNMGVIPPVDSLANDTTLTARRGDIETTIHYNARDSMYFDLTNKTLFLYGETHIDYGDISLDADLTNVDWEKRTIESDYSVDSTGKKIGKPVFKDGADVYVTNDITYNFKTKRSLIKGIVTEQDGAFMHGDHVKKNEENELFIKGARYTTCNLEYPHFFIESKKIKAIPRNKVVSGPFHIKFRDLPTPLFFPFGMFPQPKKRSSGIVVPTYGEEQRRGFFLRDGGYYFVVSEYADLRVTGDIYSKGGNGLNITSNYLKRYRFRGTFNFSYTQVITDNVENPLESNEYWVRWNHRPETRGNSSFSASVSAGTSTYNVNNNLVNQDFNRSINAQFTSNISYSKRFQGSPFNLSANFRHNQNIQTGLVNLTLPDFTLNTSRQYPFRRLAKSSKSPLAKMNFSHNFAAKNELSNRAVSGRFPFEVANETPQSDELIPFNANNWDVITARAQSGGRHTIPVSTSFSLLKYFTFNPSFNYQELWYTKELQYEYLLEENAVRVDTLEGFSRAGSWSAGASLNTRIYGTLFFKSGKIKAIRHVMVPGFSFSYRPDFSDPKFGVYKDVQVDATGQNFQRVSKFQGFAYGSPPGGESKTIGLSITNNIEMKVFSKKDTINNSKKITLFDNIGLSAGYNLAADSFNLSNLSVNARTSLLNNLISLNFNGMIDPYIRERETNRRLDKFAWNNGRGLGQLTSMTTAVGLSLSPKVLRGQKEADSQRQNTGSSAGGSGFNGGTNLQGRTYEEEQELWRVRDNPDLYVDFDVPWTLRMNYAISRSKRGFEEATVRQSLNFSGSLGLTSKTQITFNSGYDFEQKEFTTTRLGVTRDLHCWTMSFDWVPFGRFQSYFVSIRVKSSLLQDLKLEKRRNFLDFFN